MASPFTTVVSDDFNRANEASLLSPWTIGNGEGGGNFALNSNQVICTALPSDVSYSYTGRTWSADHSSKALITHGSGTTPDTGWGLCVRRAAGSRTYYRVLPVGGGSNFYIDKFVNGTYSNLDISTQTTGTGDILEFTVTGLTTAAVLTVYQNGTQIRQITDTAGDVPASGAPGMAYSSATASTPIWDNWEGGELSLAGNAEAVSYIASLRRRPVPMIKGPDTDRIAGMKGRFSR